MDSTTSHPNFDPFDGPAPAEVDALAELFLDDEFVAAADAVMPRTDVPNVRLVAADEDDSLSDEAQESSVPVTAAPIEALVLGHLPVLAPAWVPQYARHRAERIGGPVALVRLARGTVTVQLVGGDRRLTKPALEAGSLDEALDIAAAHAEAWLVRVDELDEAVLTDHAAPDSITLLTAADDAACVAAYRTLKTLSAATDDDGELESNLRVAIIAGGDRAEACEQRLRRASETFLGGRSISVEHVGRMAATASVTLFDQAGTWDAETLMTAVADAATLPARDGTDIDGLLEDVAIEPPTVLAVDEMPVAKKMQPDADVHEPATGDEAFAMPGTEATASIPTRPALLVSGIEPLEVRCPYADGVELAVDAAGALHLVAVASSDAVAALTSAAVWAKAHRRLLAAADKRVDANGQAEPVQHLLALNLVDVKPLLDSNVRVHLMVRADAVRTVDGWMASPAIA